MSQVIWELVFVILAELVAPFLGVHAHFNVTSGKERTIDSSCMQSIDRRVGLSDIDQVSFNQDSFAFEQIQESAKALSLLSPCPCVEDLLIEACLLNDAEEFFPEPPCVETLLYNELINSGEQSDLLRVDLRSSNQAFDRAMHSAFLLYSDEAYGKCCN